MVAFGLFLVVVYRHDNREYRLSEWGRGGARALSASAKAEAARKNAVRVAGDRSRSKPNQTNQTIEYSRAPSLSALSHDRHSDSHSPTLGHGPGVCQLPHIRGRSEGMGLGAELQGVVWTPMRAL